MATDFRFKVDLEYQVHLRLINHSRNIEISGKEEAGKVRKRSIIFSWFHRNRIIDAKSRFRSGSALQSLFIVAQRKIKL
jgi:hypothetical protein